MEYCEKNNIKAVIASIDQSKAFDSVDHNYMEKVYRFFGFGDRIMRWLKSIGTGRLACIQLEQGAVSETFELGRGHAQGDSPSPLLYNLAAQIQIFKIELCPNVVKLRNERLNVEPEMTRHPVYKGEGFGQTETNESFADDSSNLTVLAVDSLLELKNILENFRMLSGLSCNLEKSFVMRIGDTSGEIPQEINELGFSFANKIQLLGFTLNNYSNYVNENYECVAGKVDNLIRFWERFFLNLTAKIAIYKSLLLPQINYVVSVFAPADEVLTKIENSMEQFVLKGISIAKERIYLPVDRGGLGLFRLTDFISALQCSWIKRIYHSQNDNWRARLVSTGNGNVLNIANDSWARARVGPVLRNIMNSYEHFKDKFTRQNNNYKSVPIYCNRAFGYGRGMLQKLDDIFFGIGEGAEDEVRGRLLPITWNDITNGENVVTLEILRQRTGLELSQQQYDKIKIAFKCAKNKFENNNTVAANINQFISGFKRGSQSFRRIMAATPPRGVRGGGKLVPTVNKFASLIDCPPPGETRARSLFCTWNKAFLDSRLRVFKFKYYNNILGLNTRVAHFNADVNAACTFCSITGPWPAAPETMLHLFFYCPYVTKLLKKLERKFFVNVALTKEIFFLGTVSDDERINIATTIVLDIYRYLVWQAKLEKKTPSDSEFFTNMLYMISVVSRSSIKISDMLSNCAVIDIQGRGRQRLDGGP
jgi:hypothetical protein